MRVCVRLELVLALVLRCMMRARVFQFRKFTGIQVQNACVHVFRHSLHRCTLHRCMIVCLLANCCAATHQKAGTFQYAPQGCPAKYYGLQ